MHRVLALVVCVALPACDAVLGLNTREPPADAAADAPDAPAPPTCSDRLTMPMMDPWGHVWDGVEREPAPLEAATLACDQLGARLPTATELYRVNATTPSAIGQSFHTNYLWTLVPWGRTEQTSVRISDGTATGQVALSPAAYRCTCAPAAPATFSGSHCNGPPGAECFPAGSLNFDVTDRAAVRRSAAIFECAREHAHLADYPALVEAVHAGLPGSGANLATADLADYQYSTTMRWTGVMPTWSPVGNLAAVVLPMPAPFRCAGPAAAVVKPTITGTFAGAFYAADTTDSPVTGWAIAHSDCVARGGHIPRSSELAELIMQGLPAGTSTFLWTSDQSGFNGSSLLSARIRWTGLDLRFPYEWSAVPADAVSGWDYKSSGQPFRCVYYPLDPAFAAPASCNGGCFDVPIPGPAQMIVDATNRTPSSLPDGFEACRLAGGHLATARDLLEAIRAGLLNGTGAYLLTSEVGSGYSLLTLWGNGADPTFGDQYMAGSSYSGLTQLRPFRCVWTNELR